MDSTYLDRCRDMNFGELRKFIDRSLKEFPDTGPDADGPGSKDEFLDLWEILRAKADIPKEESPTPAPEPPPCAEYPSRPYYQPSEELDLAYERRERLLDILDEARADPSASKSYIDQVERELKDLEREIGLREAGEQEDHEKRLADYRKRRAEYDKTEDARIRYNRFRSQEAKRERKRQESLALRMKIVERVRKDIERAFKPGANVPASRPLYWQPLSQGKRGKASFDDVRRLCRAMQHRGELGKYDEERLDKAESLGPDLPPWVGPKGFDGYIIFTFPHTSKVLMECPFVGNAIYVIGSDWERWARMSKQELRADRTGQVVRIEHRGDDWFERVKEALEIQ